MISVKIITILKISRDFCESTFLGVKKGIYFRDFGQNLRNSRNFLSAKISSLKVRPASYILHFALAVLDMGYLKSPFRLFGPIL